MKIKKNQLEVRIINKKISKIELKKNFKQKLKSIERLKLRSKPSSEAKVRKTKSLQNHASISEKCKLTKREYRNKLKLAKKLKAKVKKLKSLQNHSSLSEKCKLILTCSENKLKAFNLKKPDSQFLLENKVEEVNSSSPSKKYYGNEAFKSIKKAEKRIKNKVDIEKLTPEEIHNLAVQKHTLHNERHPEDLRILSEKNKKTWAKFGHIAERLAFLGKPKAGVDYGTNYVFLGDGSAQKLYGIEKNPNKAVRVMWAQSQETFTRNGKTFKNKNKAQKKWLETQELYAKEIKEGNISPYLKVPNWMNSYNVNGEYLTSDAKLVAAAIDYLNRLNKKYKNRNINYGILGKVTGLKRGRIKSSINKLKRLLNLDVISINKDFKHCFGKIYDQKTIKKAGKRPCYYLIDLEELGRQIREEKKRKYEEQRELELELKEEQVKNSADFIQGEIRPNLNIIYNNQVKRDSDPKKDLTNSEFEAKNANKMVKERLKIKPQKGFQGGTIPKNRCSGGNPYENLTRGQESYMQNIQTRALARSEAKFEGDQIKEVEISEEAKKVAESGLSMSEAVRLMLSKPKSKEKIAEDEKTRALQEDFFKRFGCC